MTDKKAEVPVTKVADKPVKKAVEPVKNLADTLVVVDTAKPGADDVVSIRKPERVARMERAIASTELVGSKTTPVPTEKGPIVIIGGMRLSPKETGIKPNGPNGDVYVAEGREFYIPHQVRYNAQTLTGNNIHEDPWDRQSTYQGPEMSLFVFVYNSVTHYLLMDEHSSFYRESTGYFISRVPNSQLLMINSSSRDDEFLHNNALVNVETKDCVFNKSEVITNVATPGRETGWGSSGAFHLGQKRPAYENLRLKDSTILDSMVCGGSYNQTHITRSSVEQAGTSISIKSSSLDNTCLAANHIDVQGVRFDKANIRIAGRLDIKGISALTGVDWSYEGAYITNRFDFTEIDFIHRMDNAIKMMRINEDEFSLGVQWGDNIKLSLTATRTEIEEAIKELSLSARGKKKLTPSPTAYPGQYFGSVTPWAGSMKPAESIKNHLLQYATDQILSRLGMVQMLDEIYAISQDLNRQSSNYINFYE